MIKKFLSLFAAILLSSGYLYAGSPSAVTIDNVTGVVQNSPTLLNVPNGVVTSDANNLINYDPKTMGPTGQIFYFEGSSITRGDHLTGAQLANGGLTGNFGNLVSTSAWGLNHGTYYNDGVDGSTTTQMVARYTTGNSTYGVTVPSPHSKSPAITGSLKRAWFFLDTTPINNDNTNSIPTATSIANMTTEANDAIADGYYVVIILSPSHFVAALAQDQAVDQAVLDGTIPSNMIISLLDTIPNLNDANVYASTVHPSALGHQYLANTIENALISGQQDTRYAPFYFAYPVNDLNGEIVTGNVVINNSSTAVATEFLGTPASTAAISIKIPTDTAARALIFSDGSFELGGGAGARDVGIDRLSSGVVEVNNGVAGNALGGLNVATLNSGITNAGVTSIVTNVTGGTNNALSVENSTTAGFGTLSWLDSSGTKQAEMGWGNSASSAANTFFLSMKNSNSFKINSGSTLEYTFTAAGAFTATGVVSGVGLKDATGGTHVSAVAAFDASGNMIPAPVGTYFRPAPIATSNTTGTATFNNTSLDETIYNNSGTTVASLTITLPTTSAPGQIVRYATDAITTTITMAGGTRDIGSDPTTSAVGNVFIWISNTSGHWIRTQ